MPRSSWNGYGRRFAGWLDNLVIRKIGMTYGVKRVYTPRIYKYRLKIKRATGIHDPVMPGLLDRYQVHFNNWGYRVLLVNLMASFTQRYKTYFVVDVEIDSDNEED